MPVNSPFKVHEIQASIRFIQGYRYLDKCGEALVRLEDTLGEGWIPTETTPKAGSLKNDQLGMVVTFNSEVMAVQQGEFISFEDFLDQTCKIYEILWPLFELKRINSPALRVILQKGFNDGELEEAWRYLLGLHLCTPHPGLAALMAGQVQSLDFVLVTTEDLLWDSNLVHQRRRLQSQVIRQERQPPLDERMLRRTRQLGDKQQAAIAALLQLRRKHPEYSPVAVQLDVEHAFETEFNAGTLDLPTFLYEGWKWASGVNDNIASLTGEAK